MSPIRVAFIGCGAVVERSHLPAIHQIPDLSTTVLIDQNTTQIKSLSERYEVTHTGDDVNKYIDDFDLAVIATPSATHYDICKSLLQNNKHVLVEKPVSESYEQAMQLVQIAEQKNKLLAVSLVRRYLNHYRLFKSLIDSDIVGEIHEFIVEEGGNYNWPVQSVSIFHKEKAGGGVLIDTGAHLLDACMWWFGEFTEVDYYDDDMGGVEADCEIKVKMKIGCQGVIRMSRIRPLENRIQVTGVKGKLSMNLGSGELSLELDNKPEQFKGTAYNSGYSVGSTVDLFISQFNRILKCLNSGMISSADSNLVTGRQCLESIRLIEACYANRKEIEPCFF